MSNTSDPTSTLPPTHSALVLTSTSLPPAVQQLPTPHPTPGSAIIRVLHAGVISYSRDIYNGARGFSFPTPMTIGTSAIGRVAALGPDAVKLQIGQLVWLDGMIRARDNPDCAILAGVHEGHSEGSKKLMRGEWRDATYAEYVRWPLENCHGLDEGRLLGKVEDGGLGYGLEQLTWLSGLAVPYGGLRDVGVKAGETVIVAPATGAFGGAAVAVALAMGARVVAMGRNEAALERVRELGGGRVRTVRIVGDGKVEMEELRKCGPIDVFFDISPPEAEKSTHIRAAIMALRPRGRISLMGGIRGDVAIPHSLVMHMGLLIKGTWMYPREAVLEIVKMIESGVLKLDQAKVCGSFGLNDWKKAFDCAAENVGTGYLTLITPGKA